MNGIMQNIGHKLSGIVGVAKTDPDRAMRIEVVFGLLGYVAKLDSLMTSYEADFINGVMDRMKLGMKARKVALDAVARGKNRTIDVAYEFARFSLVHPPGSRESDELFTALVGLAAADQRLRPQERLFLQDAAAKLGYREEELDRRLAGFTLIAQ